VLVSWEAARKCVLTTLWHPCLSSRLSSPRFVLPLSGVLFLVGLFQRCRCEQPNISADHITRVEETSAEPVGSTSTCPLPLAVLLLFAGRNTPDIVTSNTPSRLITPKTLSKFQKGFINDDHPFIVLTETKFSIGCRVACNALSLAAYRALHSIQPFHRLAEQEAQEGRDNTDTQQTTGRHVVLNRRAEGIHTVLFV